MAFALSCGLANGSFPNINSCLKGLQFDRQVILNPERSGEFYVTDESLLDGYWTHEMHAKSFKFTVNKNELGRLVMTGFQLIVSASLAENLELQTHGNQNQASYETPPWGVEFPQDLTMIKSVYNKDSMMLENLIFSFDSIED